MSRSNRGTKLNEKYYILASLHLAGYLLVSFFDPENGGSVFLRNVNSKDSTLHSQCHESLKSNMSNEHQYIQYVTGTNVLFHIYERYPESEITCPI
jgi:hypothetical protein